MDRIIEISLALIVAAVMFVGVQTLSGINDGRIQTVVKQIVGGNTANASQSK